jgi:betaine lipid synthase
MAAYVPVPDFFAAVYLVDLSPSLCEVARKRFERLGWKNVHVVTEDVRSFRLADHYLADTSEKSLVKRESSPEYPDGLKNGLKAAELVTMSYALSMMPDFYSVVDSVSSLLAPNGVLGVADFYVQSSVEYSGRNWTGGAVDRHCTWLSRTFWRTWFEIDRVNLDPARRVSFFTGALIMQDSY